MGLISSLNNAMANLVGRPRPSDVQARPLGRPETQPVGKSAVDAGKSSSQAALEARQVRIDQTLDVSLLDYHLRQISEASGAQAQAHGFSRLQALFAPGSARGVDTGYEALYAAVTELTAAPDDTEAQANVTKAAQDMAAALNRLAANIADIGQQAGTQIGTAAAKVNSLLMQLSAVNLRLDDGNMRPDLLAQRDQLVLGLAEQVDIKVRYGDDGQVGLTTRSGVTLLDRRASRFDMDNGALTLQIGDTTLAFSAGEGANAGTLGGLLGLQNKTLVVARTQIDAIAVGLNQMFFSGTEDAEGVVSGAGLFMGGDAALIARDPAFADDAAAMGQVSVERMDSVVEIAGVSAGLGDIVGQVVAVQGQIAAQGIAAVDERRGMLEAVGFRLSAPIIGVRDEIGRLAAIESMFRSSSSLVGTLQDTLAAL